MVHFPLLAKTAKFVLNVNHSNFRNLSFNQQPYAHLFTPISLPSIWQHLQATGKLSAEQVKTYQPDYVFFPNHQAQDQAVIDALLPWFDVQGFYDKYGQTNGDIDFTLSCADIDRAISTINLLKHLYHSPLVATDDWILVVEDTTILSPEWASRVESILATLAPTSQTLQTQLQNRLQNLRSFSRTSQTTDQIAQLEAYLHPSSEILNQLQRLTYIGLNNSNAHSLEQLDSADLSGISQYFNAEIDTKVGNYLSKTPFGDQAIGIVDLLNFTNQTFFLIKKSALTALFGQSPYLDWEEQVVTPATSLHTLSYALDDMASYQTNPRVLQESLRGYTTEVLDALHAAKTASTEQPLADLTELERQLVARCLNSETSNFHERAFSTISPIQAYLAANAYTPLTVGKDYAQELNLSSDATKFNTQAIVDGHSHLSSDVTKAFSEHEQVFWQQFTSFNQLLARSQQDVKFKHQLEQLLDLAPVQFAQLLSQCYPHDLYTAKEFGIIAKRALSIELDPSLVQHYVLNQTEFSTDPSLLLTPHSPSQSVFSNNLDQAQAQVNTFIVQHNAQVLWSDFSYGPQAYYLNLEHSSLRRDYLASLTVQRLQNISSYYRSHYSHYQVLKHPFNRLLSLPALSCRLDQLHQWLDFTVGSFGMSNPVLGFVGVLNGSPRYDNYNLLKISRLCNFGNTDPSQFDPQQSKVENFDYVGKYRKFVLHDSNRHHLGEFLRHDHTEGFEIVEQINSRNLSRQQTEEFFGFKEYKENYSNTERAALLDEISRSFTYRELFARIVNDETIEDNEFIIIAEDRISLHPHWYSYLNSCFEYANVVGGKADLLLLTLHNLVGLNRVHGPKEVYEENNYVFFNNSNVIALNQDIELIELTTFQKQEYPFFCIRKRALRHYQEHKAKFDQVGSYFAGNLVALLASFELGSILVPNPILGKDLHPQQERHFNVPAINRVRELSNQVTPITHPDSENFGFNPLACAQSDPNFTGYFTGNPEIDKLYFGSNTDISEILLPELKRDLENRPYGFSNVGFSEDLVSRVKKYVLNMPTSTERRDVFLQQNNCEDFKVHNAVIGRELTEEQKDYLFDIPSFNARYGGRTISPGELGCAISHVQVLRRAIQDPDLGLDDWVMVVEDDTRLHPQWYRLLNQILLYVRDFMHDRPCIINGAQNQVPHFKLQDAEKFCTTHALLSHVDGYHKISDEIGIGFTHTDFPAGAGFYLVRKRLLIENRHIIEGKIDWVGDHFSHYYPFRHYSFAYTNPMLGYDNPELVSMLEAERVAGIEENKRKRRAIPLVNPGIYVVPRRVWIKAMPGQDPAQLQKQFKDCRIIPFVDYSQASRSELEALFDFDQHQKIYHREPTIEEINYSLQEFNLFKTISEEKASDFHFHLVVRGDSEFAPDWMHRTNCIADYIDTRLDLNTLVVYVGNNKAPQDFNKVSTAAEFRQQDVFTVDEHIYPVNDDINVCYTTGMNTNGDRGYIMLKYYCTHMFDHLPTGKPFAHAGDLVYMTPYEHKTICFASPALVIAQA